MTEGYSIQDRENKPTESMTQFMYYPDVLTVQQAAELLYVCKNTVYKLIRERQLPCRRIGSVIRIRKTDLQSFLESSHMSGSH